MNLTNVQLDSFFFIYNSEQHRSKIILNVFRDQYFRHGDIRVFSGVLPRTSLQSFKFGVFQ